MVAVAIPFFGRAVEFHVSGITGAPDFDDGVKKIRAVGRISKTGKDYLQRTAAGGENIRF